MGLRGLGLLGVSGNFSRELGFPWFTLSWVRARFPMITRGAFTLLDCRLRLLLTRCLSRPTWYWRLDMIWWSMGRVSGILEATRSSFTWTVRARRWTATTNHGYNWWVRLVRR